MQVQPSSSPFLTFMHAVVHCIITTRGICRTQHLPRVQPRAQPGTTQAGLSRNSVHCVVYSTVWSWQSCFLPFTPSSSCTVILTLHEHNNKHACAKHEIVTYAAEGSSNFAPSLVCGAWNAGLKEGDKRKESAGHVAVEHYLESEKLPYTVFQPLYIYGPHTAKDCEQWFLERILRDRPVPIPAPGNQLVALSHVEDVASMLAKVATPLVS